MAGLAERRQWRTALAVLGFPAVVAAVFVFAAVFGDDSATAAVVTWLVAVALYGALVCRWWAVALPAGWAALYLGVLRLVDLATGACSVCGSDEDWGNYPAFFFLIAVVPMTGAIFLGVLVGWLWRRRSG